MDYMIKEANRRELKSLLENKSKILSVHTSSGHKVSDGGIHGDDISTHSRRF